MATFDKHEPPPPVVIEKRELAAGIFDPAIFDPAIFDTGSAVAFDKHPAPPVATVV